MSRGVAAVVVLALLLAGCSSGSDSQSQSQSHATAPEAPPRLKGHALAFSAPRADSLYAVTDGRCDECVVLWHSDGGDWQRLAALEGDEQRSFPSAEDWGPLAEDALTMDADDKHGYLEWRRGDVWQTDDGGRSWHPLTQTPGDGVIVGTGGGYVFYDRYRPTALFRARLGSARWERLPVPREAVSGPYVAGGLFGVHGRTLTAWGHHHVFTSPDLGRTWTSVRIPIQQGALPHDPCELYRDGTGFLASCYQRTIRGPGGYGEVDELLTSADGRQWHTVATVRDAYVLAPLGDGVFLLSTLEKDLQTVDLSLLDTTTGKLRPVTPPDGSFMAGQIEAVYPYGDLVYLWSYTGAYVTTDGGATWTRLVQGP